ncbi:MAG: hypothetical protein ACKVT2_21170 [Saprospiraceae bacterium]
MKQSICLTIFLALGYGFAFAGSPALLPAGPKQTQLTASADQDAQTLEDSKKKKKKKKKKKQNNKRESNGHDKFQHGTGLSYFVAPATSTEVDNGAQSFAVSYFPSLQVVSLGSSSLNLAASPSLWFSLQSSSRVGGYASFMLDLPADLELHLGDPEGGTGIGGHLGAGFAYNRMAGTEYVANTAFGPHFSAGLRWGIFGLRASFLLNLKTEKDDYGYRSKNVFSGTFCTYF